MSNPGVKAAIQGVWKGVEWRLLRLSTETAKGFDRLWNGVRWRVNGVAWTLYSQSVYRLALLYRPLLVRTQFVGITGSAGKTTTKDLVAAILERHLQYGRKGQGTDNGPYAVARQVLKTRASDAYCVTEIALVNDDSMGQQLAFFRPTVGVVTNIGGDHVSAYGSLDGVAEEKSKLVRSLPASGVAVLNADDPRVLAMQSQFSGRTITYGISDAAMLRGDAIESSWPDRLSFTVKWNGQCARVQTQLCGSHWVPVVLAGLATGVALGVPLVVAAEAVACVEPFEGRMSPVLLEDGVTFIRDDWKAPFWTIASTFDFMRQARVSRKVIVIGTISDYSGDSTARYMDIARQAMAVADCVLFVGPRASACLRAKRDVQDQLFAFPSVQNASTFLSAYLRSGDLVLLKGSTRSDHLERLILARTGSVECWRLACRRMYWCNQCSLVHVATEPDGTESVVSPVLDVQDVRKPQVVANDASADARPPIVVVGLGNPGERYTATPHNVGQHAVDLLAQRLPGSWVREGDLAMVFRTHWEGQQILLVKLLARMNDVGPPLVHLAQDLRFAVKECILVHDDLDLPIGAVRARHRGSDGGHRGVRSIIQSFQDDKIRRVKIGIGKPGPSQSVEDYVLTPFPPERLADVEAALGATVDRVFQLVKEASISKSPVTSEEPA